MSRDCSLNLLKSRKKDVAAQARLIVEDTNYYKCIYMYEIYDCLQATALDQWSRAVHARNTTLVPTDAGDGQ